MKGAVCVNHILSGALIDEGQAPRRYFKYKASG